MSSQAHCRRRRLSLGRLRSSELSGLPQTLGRYAAWCAAAPRLALVRGRVVRQDEQDAPAAGVALHHALHLPALQGGADRGSHGGGGGARACLLAQRRPRTWKRMPCTWLLWKAACSLSSVAWPWQ